jgi:hypothetical protein
MVAAFLPRNAFLYIRTGDYPTCAADGPRIKCFMSLSLIGCQMVSCGFRVCGWREAPYGFPTEDSWVTMEKAGRGRWVAGDLLKLELSLAASSLNSDSLLAKPMWAHCPSSRVFRSLPSLLQILCNPVSYVRSFCFFLKMYASRSSGSIAILLLPTRRYGSSPL